MILADTSIWIDHLRGKKNRLKDYLEEGHILVHPFIIGELACGNLKNRETILTMMGNLPGAVTASDEEVMEFINARSLFGRGIGYIDVHLLAATALTRDTLLWTADKRLEKVALQESLGYSSVDKNL